MGDEKQILFYITLGIASALVGWWMKAVWDSLNDLKKVDSGLKEEVNNLHLVVTGQYVKTELFDRTITALFGKLDRIENKLDGKVDKE